MTEPKGYWAGYFLRTVKGDTGRHARRIVDTFPMHDELDMLELRLYELQDVPNLTHVIVEADVTHQDRPKPSYYLDNRERFAPWKDRIVHVWATGLPTVTDEPDPWAREMTQREHAAEGLRRIGVDVDDIILHGDIDEVPRVLHVRNLPRWDGVTAFGMRGHFWAVDWLYPPTWWGTVACNVRTLAHPYLSGGGVGPFSNLRNRRNIPADLSCLQPGGWAYDRIQFAMPGKSTALSDAGWHLSWLGGADRAAHKLASFCHPEVADRLDEAIADGNRYWREGVHVDGVELVPVDVDESWPRYIHEGMAPRSWFRPR